MPITFKYYYGTRAGGFKAAVRNKEKHGPDFYRNIGRSGGSAPHPTRWFALHPELAKKYGAVGGKISKRGKISDERKQELEKMRAEEYRGAVNE